MGKAGAFGLALFMTLTMSVASEYGSEGAIRVAHPAPSFLLSGLDGRQHKLEEWKGKVVLLNFWASWCFSCQVEIRDLVTYQEQYGAKGLQIVGIGMDNESKLRNVKRSLEINYPVLYTGSPHHPVMEQYGNLTGVVPYSVLISRTGEVVYAHAGLITGEIFNEQVKPLLK